MNLDAIRKWDVRGNLGQWWNALAASVVTGMDGLGAYLGGGGAHTGPGPEEPSGNSAGTLDHLSG